MKTAVLCFLVVIAYASAKPGETHYTDKYDNVDLEEILSNKRLLDPYLKCILDEGRCSPDGKELKSHVKEALETNCGKCTEKQSKGTRRVIGHLINHEADYWDKLSAKFDPENKYKQIYEKDLKTVSTKA